MDKNRLFQLLIFGFVIALFLKLGLKLIFWIVIVAILASVIHYLFNR